jgi:hypothetical protein
MLRASVATVVVKISHSFMETKDGFVPAVVLCLEASTFALIATQEL